MKVYCEIYWSLKKALPTFENVVKAEHAFQTSFFLLKVEQAVRNLWLCQFFKQIASGKIWISFWTLKMLVMRRGLLTLVAKGNDGHVLVVAAFHVHAPGRLSVAGGCHGCDYVDFIYNHSLSDMALQSAFCQILVTLRDLKFKSLSWPFLDEKSRSFDFLSRCGYAVADSARQTSMAIHIDQPDYAVYFSTLTKSVRQNIRTAYNRLSRDNHRMKVQVYRGGVSSELAKRCEVIYFERQKAYGKKLGCFSSWIDQHLIPVRMAIASPNSYVATLAIDDKVVAFLFGYKSIWAQTIEVPRLAVDMRFAFYSPGMILVNELLKLFFATHEIRMLDLCRGAEKYKYDFGGDEYFLRIVHVDL